MSFNSRLQTPFLHPIRYLISSGSLLPDLLTDWLPDRLIDRFGDGLVD